MAGRFFCGTKRSCSDSSSSSSSNCSTSKKRKVSIGTFEKWQRQFDGDYQTLLWLRCTKDDSDRSVVSTLFCEVCKQYAAKICGMRNFSSAWIDGSANQKTSNILDHARSEQHATSMTWMRRDEAKANNQPLESYAPIAHYLLTMEEAEKERMRHKFQICYVLARESIAFQKYPAFHRLAEQQEVRMGSSYKRSENAKTFTYFIAEAQRSEFVSLLSQKNFFSFMMDGSTDAGNKEQEIVFVLYCDKDDKAKKIRSTTRYFAIVNPSRSTAEGLVDCLGDALKRLDIDVHQKDSVLNTESRPVLVGGGTDGASVNVGTHNGMKSKMQETLPWLYWAWCFSHRLQLACRDTFKSSLFAEINDMLLQLYYLYHKSPKKTQELIAIADDLKEVFEFPKGGSVPVRCQGTRWISYKRKALQRVLDRYGAYVNHLTTLIEDSTVKGEDKAKFQGYLRKWSRGKILIGCAMYVDVLKAPSILSSSLQEDHIDIVQGINSILRSSCSLKALTKETPKEWLTVKLVVSRITEEGSNKVYQGANLTNYSDVTLTQCSAQVQDELQKLNDTIKDRLSWSDTKLLRSVIVFLDTRSWDARPGHQDLSSDDNDVPSDDKANTREAVEYIVTVFREPLEAKQVCIFALPDEIDEIVDFYRKYLETQAQHYREVWYKLYTAHDARKWANVILVSELLFSLPFTNSEVERSFSSMKIIKTNRRTSLHTSTLDDLMEIKLEGPELESFSPDNAIHLWWSERTRRPNQASRKEYRKRARNELETEETELHDEASTLQAWDDWFSNTEPDVESD